MRTSPRQQWRRGAVLGLLATIALAGLAYDGARDQVALQVALQPPSSLHWMGTDELGRDVFTRTLRGVSVSLVLSVLAWVTALGIGLALGTVTGYFVSSVVDRAVSWLIALAYVTPYVVILLGLVSVVGPGLVNAYVALTLFAWVAPARQARTSVRTLRFAPHVVAARSVGFHPAQLFQLIIIPEIYRPALIASLAVLPEIIAFDATLSLFGLGAQPPSPTLGRMIVDGISYLSLAWWMSLFPVAMLAVVCLSVRALAQSLSTRTAAELTAPV